MHYFENLTVGQTIELGSISISDDDIVEFAQKYDPQMFHLDKKVATDMFGGLIASGWQTASLGQRLLVDNFLGQTACMASPGVDSLKFLKPVFGGDELIGTLIIHQKNLSKSKPDRGLVKILVEMKKADGTPTISLIGNIIVGCQPQSFGK